MIDNSVQAVLVEFKERWNPLLQISPRIVLDDTWPSVGVLDLLTFSFRLQEQLSLEDQGLIRGSAAYLATVIAKCWSRVAAEVTIGSDADGIYLRADGGGQIPPGDHVSVAIEAELRKMLKQLPYPFPVIERFSRPISFDSNILCPFAIGIASGLSPLVCGAWEEKTAESFGPPLLEISKELAIQSANYYARVFPDEPFGQVAEIYLSGLIFPPLFIGESLPGFTSSNKLLDYFLEYGVSVETMRKVAHNLALMPEDLISTAGLVLYAALAEQSPPAEIIAVAQNKGRFMGMLRHAMAAVRRRLNFGADWIVYGIKSEEDKLRFEIEQQLEMLPWLYLSREFITEKQEDVTLNNFLVAICAFDIKEAEKALDKMIEQTPGEIELRLQKIRLEMLKPGQGSAEKMFGALLSEPGADNSPRFYHLWGLFMEKHGEPGAAEKYFRAAYSLKGAGSSLRADIANNLGWARICAEDYQQALEYIEAGLSEAICPITLLLNKLHALWRLRRYEEAMLIRKKLLHLAPTDRRVFAGLSLAPNESSVKRR